MGHIAIIPFFYYGIILHQIFTMNYIDKIDIKGKTKTHIKCFPKHTQYYTIYNF